MELTRIEQIPAVKAFGARLLGAHQFVYERSGGRIGHRILGVPCLLLHTVGAKTGLQRTNGLTYARDGDDHLVVASAGGAPRSPGWYHNLRAHPEAEIQVGTRRLPVTARAVLPGDPGYERLWDIVNANNHDRYRAYQKATTRPIPVVVLTPRT
nr:putative nitroreductase Rv1261c [uncultured bacterium]